jgi:hypothetical protein
VAARITAKQSKLLRRVLLERERVRPSAQEEAFTIYRIAADKVAEEWPLFDALGLKQQLSAFEQAGPRFDRRPPV